MSAARSVLFVGRHAGYPVALVEDRLPVFCVVPPLGRDLLHDKMISGIQEVRARGARTIVLAQDDDEVVAPYADVLLRLPAVSTLLQPLVAVVPLQLFACELATVRGHDVDQPRNLAKSVTVE
jgi:glucosamine--fructose-6-phosphate aminotransferase (isomerizing)